MKQKGNRLILGIIGGLMVNSMIPFLSCFARHHHHHHVPPPKTVEKKEDENTPQQTIKDADSIPSTIRQKMQGNQRVEHYQPLKQENKPALLLPNHYTRGDKGHLNAEQGWVNSKRQRGHHDIGINAPLPQTADPTQNKTRNVFRRAMPIYEPNY